jgi:hypothetical protein
MTVLRTVIIVIVEPTAGFIITDPLPRARRDRDSGGGRRSSRRHYGRRCDRGSGSVVCLDAEVMRLWLLLLSYILSSFSMRALWKTTRTAPFNESDVQNKTVSLGMGTSCCLL